MKQVLDPKVRSSSSKLAVRDVLAMARERAHDAAAHGPQHSRGQRALVLGRLGVIEVQSIGAVTTTLLDLQQGPQSDLHLSRGNIC
jgi:hypothetical protein